MTSYIRAHLSMLPMMAYLLVAGLGWQVAGAAIGLLLALARAAWLAHTGRWLVFECAMLIALLVLLPLHLLAGPLGALPHAILFGALGLGAAASVAIGRPWTAEFSAADYKSAERTALFLSINRLISGLWAALFVWLALAALLGTSSWLQWGPLVLGGVASVLGPKWLVRRGLEAMLRQPGAGTWPAPALHTAAASPVRVVGAGIGGLTAAALLADAGVRVVVHEQHDLVGGFAHNWPRRARGQATGTGAPLLFRFDSGVHDISGWQPGGPLRSLFARLGIEGAVEMRRLDHRRWDHGSIFDPPRDPAAFTDALAARHLAEAEGMRRLLGEIREIYDAMYATGAGRNGIPGPPDSPEGLLAFARRHPLAATWMQRPWSEFLARHLRGEAARAEVSALTAYITDQPDTLCVAQMVPLFGYAFHGGVYPIGGSGRLAEALAGAIRARGGEVRLGEAVARIDAAGGRASGLVLAGSTAVLPAAAVVLNADALAAAWHLLPPGAMVPALGSARPACSAIGVHLGLRGALDMPPVLHARTRLGAVHMVAPSLVDPTAAPAGHSSLELLALVPWQEAAGWLPAPGAYPPALDATRRTEAYRARKAAAAAALLDRAAEVISDLRERIVFRADASPLTFQRYGWTSAGAIYGLDRRIPTKQPLAGLVVAGAATGGAGVEAVAISGAWAAESLVPGLLAQAT